MTFDLDEPLRVIVTTTGLAPLIALEGELDPHTAPLFERALSDLLEGGTTDVVVDLAALDFMDSSGLRVLIAAHKELEADNATLTLRNPNPTISRLLDITNLRAHLRVEG